MKLQQGTIAALYVTGCAAVLFSWVSFIITNFEPRQWFAVPLLVIGVGAGVAVCVEVGARILE